MKKLIVPIFFTAIMMISGCAQHNEALQDIHDDQPIVNYAFGDSTVSLSDGQVVSRHFDNKCAVERGNWASLLPGETTNLSCPGFDIKQTKKIVEQSDIDTVQPDNIFITIGSNQMRNDKSLKVSREELADLVDTIHNKSPQSELYFVGYLKIDANSTCLQNVDKSHQDYATYLDTLHDRGDQGMREISRRKNIAFINMRHLEYDLCGTDTFVRLPWEPGGAPWHTTPAGHRAIADEIIKNIS